MSDASDGREDNDERGDDQNTDNSAYHSHAWPALVGHGEVGDPTDQRQSADDRQQDRNA